MEINLLNVYIALVIFTIFQRLLELLISKRNEHFLKNQGAKIISEINYIYMILLHTLWLVSIVFLLIKKDTHISTIIFTVGLVLFILGQFLRISAILTLGKRWSTKIIVLPGKTVIRKGIFKIIRHPNYLGVTLEILALPLMGGFINLAILFSALNLIVLFYRIRLEEKTLGQYNDYFSKFSIDRHET